MGLLTVDPDGALLARLRSGEEAALAELVERYSATVMRVARVYVPSTAVAEEVVQETWLVAELLGRHDLIRVHQQDHQHGSRSRRRQIDRHVTTRGHERAKDSKRQARRLIGRTRNDGRSAGTGVATSVAAS